MRSYIRSMLVSCSTLAAAVSLFAAQTTLSQDTIVVESGSDLRCRLERGLRITKVGEPVTAKLVEPIYIGTTLAIPEGSKVVGHVSFISAPRSGKRVSRILSGDFTPPKTASVSFEQIVLSDGTVLPIHTNMAMGISDVQMVRYLPKNERPGLGKKVKEGFQPIVAPNKLQRLREAAIKSLPYHPEYLDQGTIFDATLLDPITTPIPAQPVAEVDRASTVNYVHLRLLTPLTSETVTYGTPIHAVISRPYYGPDHVLHYPAGTTLEGTVRKAVAAKKMKKNGALLFSFNSVAMPDGTTVRLNATVEGVQAPGGHSLAVGQEGDIAATTSRFAQLRAPLSLIGPSRAVADSTVNKTGWSRATEGNRGFGLLGAGAAQASAATATGFGYFGAAVRIYAAFLAKGSDVELPAGTPIFLRLNEEPSSSISQSGPSPVSDSLNHP